MNLNTQPESKLLPETDREAFHLIKLKDPIYGYVYLSELEDEIIQHPLMLRLHHIRQNSTAFLTYPTAHGTRFAHSIGAMHVAGAIASRAFHAAEPDARAKVKEVIAHLLSRTINYDLTSLTQRILTHKNESARLNNDGLYRVYSLAPVTSDEDLAILLLFQGLRLGSLIHDLGHPPFSHIAEHAFKDALPKEYRGHEETGATLLKGIITGLGDKCAPLGIPALTIANALVRHPSPLPQLSFIVSGEIDSDRLDYVRRDAATVNMPISSFDSQRIIDAARLGVNGGDPWIYLTTDALSAVEAFLVARLQLYRWMIWHHNVVRMDLCLERALRSLVLLKEQEVPAKLRPEWEALLTAVRGGTPQAYVSFDDGSLLWMMKRMMNELRQNAPSTKETSDLLFYLEVFLERQVDRLRPLWKQVDEYADFAERVMAGMKHNSSAVEALNALLREKTEGKVERIIDFEPYLSEKLGRQVSMMYLSHFRPCPGDDFVLVSEMEGTQKMTSINQLSPTVVSLKSAWDGMMQLWIFIHTDPDSKLNCATLRQSCAGPARAFLEGAK